MHNRMVVQSARLSAEDVATDYYMWLCDLIWVNQPDRSYWLLAKTMHQKPFYWSVPNDDNRVYEAKDLREWFCDIYRVDYRDDYFNNTVSMLELIISLAHRCETILEDRPDSISMREWFWRLLKNAGLEKYTDEAFYDLNGGFNVDEILNMIIDRTYHRNGKGGLFPLNNYKKDQRRVELWYQMNAYLIENYYMDEEDW